MYCGKCGKENTDGIRFCIHCGADMAQQTPQPVVPPSTPTPETDETIEDTDALREDVLDAGRTPAGKGSRSSDPGDVPHAQARMASIDALKPGRMLSARYKILCRLGVGGMGEVFKAEDRELNDMKVAVKVLPPLLASNTRSINRLRTEAAIALKLTHPSICRLHTFRIDGDLKFLVMEYIEGKTLEEMLDESATRKMTLEALLPIATNVADALDFAHRLKPPILHRDIKPSNIMVDPSGRGKVLDFGIARELKDSMTRLTGKDTSGTLLYMSPEQFTGGTPTVSSDIYSFAAMIYECLAGHAPFWQGSIAHQLLNQLPSRIPGLPSRVNDGLLAGLAKNGTDRPSSARQLVRMLEGKSQPCAAAAPPCEPAAQTTAAPTPGAATGRRQGRYSRIRIAAALAAVIVLTAAFGVWLKWWPLVGVDKPAVVVAEATVDDVVALKDKAQNARERLGDVDEGQGISRRISAVDILLRDAREAETRGKYTDALKTYSEVVSRCEIIMQLDRDRTTASELRGSVAAARTAAEKVRAASLAAEYWSRGEELLAMGGRAFTAGTFAEAAQAWRDAKRQYDRSRRRAVYCDRVAGAKKTYDDTLSEALKKIDLVGLDKYGGEGWKRTKAAVGAAEAAGFSQEGVDKWKQAAASLAKAWRVALAEKGRSESVSRSMTTAVAALDAGRLSEAATAVKSALAVKPDYRRAMMLERTINGAKLLAASEAAAQEKPPEALANIAAALASLNAALKITPGDSRAAKLKRRAETLKGELSGLFRLERTLIGHSEWITSLAMRPKGTQVVSGSLDDSVKVWDLASGRCVRTLDAGGDVAALAFSADGVLLCWATGSRVTIFDLDGQVGQPVSLEGHLLSVLSVAMSPTGANVATGSGDDTARIWRVATGICTAVLKHEQDVNCVAFSPVDGNLLATGSEDRHVRLWNVADGKLASVLAGHTGKVLAVAFSPDGKLLAAGDDDKTVRIWDVSSGKCIKVLTGHKRAVSSVAFRPDGLWLASAGGDKTVRLWDIRTGRNIQILRGHKDWVRAIAFSPDGRRLVSCGDDKTVIVWAAGPEPRRPETSPKTSKARR